MSSILLNSGAAKKIITTKVEKPINESDKKKTVSQQSRSEIKVGDRLENVREQDEIDDEAREERKATGRSVAIVIFLSLMCLALYHVVQRKTTILAGVGDKLL